MKSLKQLGTRSISLPLLADDVLEFHAARLLLLLKVCGTAGRIEGLTKMAKLDFFARYPDFFAAAKAAGISKKSAAPNAPIDSGDAVESAMIRHHYGPWDKRYYHILAHLEAKKLIDVTKHKNAYWITLTEMGSGRAKALVARPSFAPLVSRMREVKQSFGGRSGNSLKDLIYTMFDREVGRRPLGEMIQK